MKVYPNYEVEKHIKNLIRLIDRPDRIQKISGLMGDIFKESYKQGYQAAIERMKEVRTGKRMEE